jgi:thiosulfate/3-mercaptopyruvate sulfurtransferase
VPSHPEFLVSTDWLAEHLHDPDVRVLDVSGHLDADRRNLARDDYLAEHIPGAIWFDMASGDGELSDPDSPLAWTWPPVGQIESAMGRVGVDGDTTVVITARSSTRPYGHGTMWCTRTWWTLHHSGVDCVILAGGLERWIAEGRPTASGDPTVEPRSFTAVDRRREAIADRSDVQVALASTDSCVIDALPASSFRGERVNYARPGHITGARNVPFHQFIAEPTADFIAEPDARVILEGAGLFDRERAVLY